MPAVRWLVTGALAAPSLELLDPGTFADWSDARAWAYDQLLDRIGKTLLDPHLAAMAVQDLQGAFSDVRPGQAFEVNVSAPVLHASWMWMTSVRPLPPPAR